MNLIEKLADELKDKHLNEFEKTRYIYLRCCELFSYDARWNYYRLFSDSVIKEIENKMFDVRNLSSNLVICHSFSKSILKPLLDELTTLETTCIGEQHSCVGVKFRDKEFILDATLGDFPLMKMGLRPEGFMSSDGNNTFIRLDYSLGFRYVDKDIYSSKKCGDDKESMNKVGNIISSSKCKYSYSDVAFLYNYLTENLKQQTKTYLDEHNNLYRKIHLFNNDNEYILSKKNGEYSLSFTNEKGVRF